MRMVAAEFCNWKVGVEESASCRRSLGRILGKKRMIILYD